jgi:hypothetical protein
MPRRRTEFSRYPSHPRHRCSAVVAFRVFGSAPIYHAMPN